jgi:hypothetical protein
MWHMKERKKNWDSAQTFKEKYYPFTLKAALTNRQVLHIPGQASSLYKQSSVVQFIPCSPVKIIEPQAQLITTHIA